MLQQHSRTRRRTGWAPHLALGIGASAALALLVACQSQAAPADFFEGAPPPPPSAESRLSASVDYDYSSVLQLVERVVPRKFGARDSVHMVGLDPRKHYSFEAERGPFTAFADGGVLHLRATLAYGAKAYYKPFLGPTLNAGCGRHGEQPRLVVELATPLTVTSDWHLKSRARVVLVEPASSELRDQCNVSLVHYDVTPRVIAAAKAAISKKLPDIDRKVASIDLRDRFAGWWGTLARPIRLSDGVWLLIGPERVGMGRVSGSGHVITVPVNVGAHPRIVTTAQAPAVEATTLPDLDRAAPSDDGFHVLVEGVVDYGTASRAVSLALGHRTLAVGGRTITVESVTVSVAPRGRMALTVAFTGDAHGTLRFVGTPALDRERREITVPDLDYDLNTDNQLINAYAWLRSDALRSTFREKARVPVDPTIERGKALLLKGLNRQIGSAVSLAATVDSVALRALYATRAGLIVRAEARGQAALSVRPGAPHPAGSTVAGGAGARAVAAGAQLR